MEIRFALQLPRDSLSVPVVRRLLAGSMDTLGIEKDCTHDIEVALTEACTNVLDHAVEGDEYEVSAGIRGGRCVLEIIDTGRGFDADHLGRAQSEPSAEEGRGIHLIRQLVDTVKFENRPERGTIVHLEKNLVWHDGAPIRRLLERSSDSANGPWERRES